MHRKTVLFLAMVIAICVAVSPVLAIPVDDDGTAPWTPTPRPYPLDDTRVKIAEVNDTNQEIDKKPINPSHPWDSWHQEWYLYCQQQDKIFTQLQNENVWDEVFYSYIIKNISQMTPGEKPHHLLFGAIKKIPVDEEEPDGPTRILVMIHFFEPQLPEKPLPVYAVTTSPTKNQPKPLYRPWEHFQPIGDPWTIIKAAPK
jgi:hypothetical protein